MDVSSYDFNCTSTLVGKLERCLESNIVCYDADATRTVFSKRLVALMKTVFRRTNKKVPTKIYIPSYSCADITTFFDFDEEVTEKSQVKVFDLEVIFYDEDEEGENLIRIYDESFDGDTNYPPGKYEFGTKPSIVIMEGSDKYLIGMY